MVRKLKAFYWTHSWVQSLIGVLGCILIGLLLSSPVILQIVFDLNGWRF